jgi:hypothetical protein
MPKKWLAMSWRQTELKPSRHSVARPKWAWAQQKSTRTSPRGTP